VDIEIREDARFIIRIVPFIVLMIHCDGRKPINL